MKIQSVHPLAELFPMLSKPELAALADDIKANGLREPIKVTKEGVLVEGRNRLAACELADVEPRYEEVNGDAGDLIVSANIFRRHMTKGQIALLAVVAETGIELPENDSGPGLPAGGGLGATIEYDYRKQAHKRVEGLVSFNVLRDASRIVKWAPGHARTILDTGQGWKEAIETAKQRSKDASSEEARIRVLEEKAPQYLAQVGEDGLTLDQAWRLYQDEERQDRETRIRLTGYVVDAVKELLSDSNVEQLIEKYEPEFANIGNRKLELADFDYAITRLRAIRTEIKRQGKDKHVQAD